MSLFRSLRADRSCLSNVPVKNSNEMIDAGKIWSVDDQCKQVYGLNASFCRVIYFFKY